MDQEEWRTVIIDGEETNYEVSDLGRIRNTKTNKILNPCPSKNGYITVRIKGKTRNLHRLVLTAFVDNEHGYSDVNHMDGNKENNRIDNLEWTSRSKNVKHAWDNGLTTIHKSRKGENNNASHYSEDEIVEACELLQTGDYTIREVSDLTGIGYMTVHGLSTKTRWTHISENYDFDCVPNGKNREDYSKYHNSIDRTILSETDYDEIIDALLYHGLTEESAESLYSKRAKTIEKGKSIVQYTVYIDEGEEIF